MSFLCLRPPFLVLVDEMTGNLQTPFSSQDPVFQRTLSALPPPLLEALKACGMTSPCHLRAYPRTPAEQLGLLPLVVLGPGESGAHTMVLGTPHSSVPHTMVLGTPHSSMTFDDGTGTQDVLLSSIVSPPAAVAAVSFSPSLSVSASSSASVSLFTPTHTDRDLESGSVAVSTPATERDLESGPVLACTPATDRVLESGFAPVPVSRVKKVKTSGKEAAQVVKTAVFPRISKQSKNAQKVRESSAQILRAEVPSNGCAGTLAQNLHTVSPSNLWGAVLLEPSEPVQNFVRDSQTDSTAEKTAQIVSTAAQKSLPPPDFLVPYHTLVRDGALPPHFEDAFCTLEVPALLAATRQDRKVSTVTNMQATTWPQERQKLKTQEARLEKSAADQFFLAADKAPRRYRAKFQRGLYAGPNARTEAEETERTKWIEVLAAMLTRTPTPMGALLASQPSNMQLLGAGKRASTLRSWVWAVKRFLDWLALTNSKGYPTSLEDFTGYLQARKSEPCTRGALRGAHKALVFLEEVAGVTSEAKVTTTSQSTSSSRGNFSPALSQVVPRNKHRGCSSACSQHSSS